MGRSLDEVISTLPAERRERIEARTAELVAEEMTLRDLRRAMGKTQAQIAKLTGKPQATISRMESQSDMLLSNLDQVLRAMGGRVRVIAELPGRRPVVLNGIGDLAPTRNVEASDAKERGAAKPPVPRDRREGRRVRPTAA